MHVRNLALSLLFQRLVSDRQDMTAVDAMHVAAWGMW